MEEKKIIVKEEKSEAVRKTLGKFFSEEEQEQKQAQFDAVQKLREQMEEKISAVTKEREIKAKKQIEAFESSDKE